jgi:hypothetical protein
MSILGGGGGGKKPKVDYTKFFEKGSDDESSGDEKKKEEMDEDFVDDPSLIYPDDDTYGDPKETGPFARPGWKPKTYDDLKAAQTKNGKLYCALKSCGLEIELDANGYETGPMVVGYKNVGRPPIDHYQPDWVTRKAKAQKELRDKGITSLQAMRNYAIQVFHLPPLRITHKKCNLSRGKQHS